LFGAQRKWRYYWKHRFEIWAIFFFADRRQPRGFVGSQELLVENDRAASQPQRLRIRKLSNAITTQIISYFIPESLDPSGKA